MTDADHVRPIAAMAAAEEFEVSYTRLHGAIPHPTTGFEVDWAARNAHLGPMHGDQRSCPAIRRRELIGITVAMPYTVQFARDGHMTVSQLLGPDDRRMIEVWPREARSSVLDRTGTRYVPFPATLVTLPAAVDEATFAMFVLGDLRLDTWIVESGVFVRDLPDGYTGFAAALPGHRYPDTYSIGQGVAESFDRIRGHLKIPIELQFNRLPLDQSEIVIERGTPMMQWIVAKLPAVRLREFPSAPQPRQLSRDTRLALSEDLRIESEHHTVVRDADRGRVEIEVGEHERPLLDSLADHPRLGDALAAAGIPTAQGMRAAGELERLGVLQIADLLPDSAQQWDLVYRFGAYRRWTSHASSPELVQFAAERGEELFRLGDTALDIGAGPGGDSLWLADYGFRVTAVDVSATAADILRRSSARAGLDVEVRCADICEWDEAADGAFVLANDRGCFHHLIDTDARSRYLGAIGRVLCPDGVLFLRGYRGTGEAPVRVLEPSQGRTAANLFRPIDPDRLAAEFEELFLLDQVTEFAMRTDQLQLPAIAIVLRRRRG